MKPNALAIANYLIDLYNADNEAVRPLKLMKLVYICHGFILALTDRSALNPNYDRVEAWKYGPVIPSVYHSFKHFGRNPITEKTIILNEDSEGPLKTPMLEDEELQKICRSVYKMHKGYSDFELVEILHYPGTPWSLHYSALCNKEIPDSSTQEYYKRIVDTIVHNQQTKSQTDE